MNKKWPLLAGMVFLFAALTAMGVPHQAAVASWVHFSSQELIQKSDAIVIGDIVGPVGEDKVKSQGLPELWGTYWKVNVYCYLKGNPESNELIVETPGAENKSIGTSIDYRLDEWGNTILLFLRQKEGFYQPLSPQGIISLKKNEYSQKNNEPLDGQIILKKYGIADPKISGQEKNELEKFILKNRLIVIPKNVPQTQPFSSKTFTPEKILALLLILLVLVSAGIVFAGRRLKKEQ